MEGRNHQDERLERQDCKPQVIVGLQYCTLICWLERAVPSLTKRQSNGSKYAARIETDDYFMKIKLHDQLTGGVREM